MNETPFEIVRPFHLTIALDALIVEENEGTPQQASASDAAALRDQLAAQLNLAVDGEVDDTWGAARDLVRVDVVEAGLARCTVGPIEDVGEARIELEMFQRALMHALQPQGMRAIAAGCAPKAPASEQTAYACTTISLERADGKTPENEESLVRALAPLLALFGDNAPRVADAANGSHLEHARLAHAEGRDVTCDGARLTIALADAMPAPFVTAFATLVKGLLASDESIEAARVLANQPDDAAVEEAWDEIAEHGFDATAYGKPASQLAEELIACAREALASNEHNYLVPLQQLARKRMTLTQQGNARHAR